MTTKSILLWTALAVAGCSSAPPPSADSYTGKWSGTWISTASPRAGNRIDADLSGSADRLEGTVKFVSVLWNFTLPVAQTLPKSGKAHIDGMADASSGNSKVKVVANFVRRGEIIEGDYEFPVIDDRGTFTVTRTAAR